MALKPLVVRVADVDLAPRLPQCTTRSLLHAIQPLYYVPAESQGQLADVVQHEQCVRFWTALYPVLLSISGLSDFLCH